jgi:hypothetical protein
MREIVHLQTGQVSNHFLRRPSAASASLLHANPPHLNSAVTKSVRNRNRDTASSVIFTVPSAFEQVPSSGRPCPTNMASDRTVSTMETTSFNSNELMSTITKSGLISMCPVPSWSISSLVPWTLFALGPLVLSSDRTTSSLVRAALGTTGLKDVRVFDFVGLLLSQKLIRHVFYRLYRGCRAR